MSQHYANHRRMVPGFHYYTGGAIVAILIYAIICIVSAALHESEDLGESIFYLLIALSLIGLFWYARSFALKAQDRAIRAEENFRHFVLTGSRLPASLKMSQIIALRFAPDEEMPALAAKAEAEQLSANAIKQAIKNWKADYHRV